MSKYLSEIKCAKCQQDANNRPILKNDYCQRRPVKAEDGKFYCFECFKNASHCKGCGNSVANLKLNQNHSNWRPVSEISLNCDQFTFKCEFVCSKTCSQKYYGGLREKEYQEWKEKLNQGWTKCEECTKLVKSIIEENGWNWLKEEKKQILFLKLAPPGQKLCEECKHYEEVGKPKEEKVRAQAQEYWNSLSLEDKLKEVNRSGSVRYAEFYGKKYTAEEIAARETVPTNIEREFQSKASHLEHNCENCQLNDSYPFNTSGDNPANFASASSLSLNNENSLETKTRELRELMKEGKDWKRISELKQEIETLNNQQIDNSFSPKYWMIGISIFILLGGVIFLIKRKKTSSKSQAIII